jgi:hypothetical protein
MGHFRGSENPDTLISRRRSMTEALKWLQSAPASAISGISAVLAAFVALTVLILTQWILGRRARSDLLTRKLEDLYLLILQWRDEIDTSKFAADDFLGDQTAIDEAARKEFAGKVHRPRLDRRVSMYVHFYFPQLLHFEQQVGALNRDNAKLLRRMGEGEKVTRIELQRAWLKLHLQLGYLQQEILDNRTFFIRNTLIKPPYKRIERPDLPTNE